MPRVLLESQVIRRREGEFRQILGSAGFEVVTPSQTGVLSEQEFARYLPDVDAVIMGVGPFSVRMMDLAPRLRVISRTGVGYEKVDLAAATHRQSAVTITPGANHEGVAEHTMALILSLLKDLQRHDRTIRRGIWDRSRLTRPVRGQILGIVGMGRIGQAVATRALAFGMKVLVQTPRPRPFADVEFVDLDSLLSRSDIISLHLPLTSESTGLFNHATFAKTKPGVILINTSRGGLVVEADLVDTLSSGQVEAAALDVFGSEPIGQDHPLFRLDNVLLSPHLSGIDTASVDEMARLASENLVALYQGRWPKNSIVNPELGSSWTW